MTLSFIGLGLGDEKDITLKGLECVRKAERVYLEYYTSQLCTSIQALESFFEKKIILATRTMVEADDNEILTHAKTQSVAFLVIGDVFSATTHSDLFLRAKQAHIHTEIIHNASILTAIGQTGLQLYKFGKTTSLVFFESDWKPTNAYETLLQNTKQGLHTLCLLDIKVAEPSKTDLASGKTVAQKPRFMTIKQALEQLLEIESLQKKDLITLQTKVVGVARLGSTDSIIKYGTIAELLETSFGEPLHSLIFLGDLHFHEEEVLTLYS